MLTLAEELARLQQAEEHVSDAIRRIEAQRSLVASMAGDSRDKALATALLAAMEATLEQFTFHRDAIVENVVRLRVQGVQNGQTDG